MSIKNRDIVGDRRYWALVVIVVGWMFSFGIRLIYPSLVEYVRIEFEISNSVVGFLFTLIMAGYGLMQFPSGILSDTVGERRILLVSLSVTTVGCTLIAFSPAFLLFASGCVIFGLGSGMYSTPQLSILSKMFPDRTATVHGIAFGAGGVGTVLPVVAGSVAAAFSWRLGFGVMIPGVIGALVGLWLFVPPVEQDITFDLSRISRQIRPVISNVTSAELVVPFLATVLIGFVYQAISAFLPTFLIDIKSVASLPATLIYGLFFVLGIGSQIYGGVLGDRYELELLLFGMALLGSLGLGVIAVTDSLILLVVMIVPLSFISGFISMSNTYILARLPDAVQGGGLGLIRTGILLIGATSPTIVGLLADWGYFVPAFLGCAGLLLFAAGLSLYMHYRL
jgi:MFS family permease